MFDALSASPLAQWVAMSLWAYPTFLTAHGLGMAVVVGLTVMIGARILGFPSQVPLAPYIRTVPFGIFAFVVNAASGILLFIADASTLSRNPSFIVKIVLIVIGLVVLQRLYAGPLKRATAQAAAGEGDYRPTAADRRLAIAAILLWSLAVIVSGRAIAYLAPEF